MADGPGQKPSYWLDNEVERRRAAKERKTKPSRTVVIRRKREVVAHSRILIKALEDALAFDLSARPNERPPELHADLNLSDPTARNEIRELIAELKKLNTFLEQARRPTAADKPVIHVRKHLNTMLDRCAKGTGYGAGILITSVAATILQELGVDFSVLAPIFGRVHR